MWSNRFESEQTKSSKDVWDNDSALYRSDNEKDEKSGPKQVKHIIFFI